MALTVTAVSKLSPTHFVSNIRYQHRCNLLKPGESNLGVCELIFDFKELFSYTNCTELNIQFLKSINEESKRTDDDLDKIMSSGMVLVNNILNGTDESVGQQRTSPIDGRFGLN